MLNEDYLNLKLVHLKAGEQWGREHLGVCFLFPRTGVGRYLKGDSKQELLPGDVLVVNGEPGACVFPHNSADFAFWGFFVRLEHLFPLFGCAEAALFQTIMARFKANKLYPASSPLAAACHRLLVDITPQFNLDHRGQLLRVASLVLNEEFKATLGTRVTAFRQEDHIVQVFESLGAEKMLSLSVPELARRFGCSRRHLNRLFHEYFGISVGALRMEMRLMKAVALLRDTDAKVVNVAEQCGFNHLGLFNTCFRKRFGASPGQWRKVAAATEARQEPEVPKLRCPLRMTGLCPLPASHRVKPEALAKVAPAYALPSIHQNGNTLNSGCSTHELGDEATLDMALRVVAAQKCGAMSLRVNTQK